MKFRKIVLSTAFVLTASLLGGANASAQAIITNGGGVYLGVNALGHLNVPDGTGGVFLTPTNSSSIGLYYAPVDGDATAPGCLCEGFGIAANGLAGYADISAGGVVNLSSVSFSSTASTATAIAALTSLPGFTVKQEYKPSLSPGLFENVVTLTNATGATATDVRYNRTMDWDIPPTTFSELVTIQGWPATALIDSCDDGFETPNPLADCSSILGSAPEDSNFAHSGPADHGARFTFAFGDLADGASKSFSIFYGAAPTELAALAALGTVGAEVYSFGQCDPSSTACLPGGGPATFIFGFAGVGGTPVPPAPEPGTLLMLGTAVVGLARRYSKS